MSKIRRHRRFRAFLGLVAGCAGMVLALVGCGKAAHEGGAEKSEVMDYSAMRTEAVDRILKGTITPADSGVATLPQDLKGASSDGQALVFKDATAGFIIAFNLTPEGSARPDYLVYSKQALPANATVLAAGSVSFAVRARVDDHWCRAVPAR